MLCFARKKSSEGAVMKKRNHTLSQSLPSILLGFLSFLTLALIFALSATLAHSAEVTLAWNPNTEPDLAGYKLYYKTGSSGEPYDGTGATEGDSPIDIGNVTTYTLYDLTDDTSYFFVVTAYDDQGGESDYSNEVSTDDYGPTTSIFSGDEAGACFIAMAASTSNTDRTVHVSPRAAAGYGLTLITSLLCMVLYIQPIALLFGSILLLLTVVCCTRRFS